MELTSERMTTKAGVEVEVNLDVENGNLYVDGLKYELEGDVLDVILFRKDNTRG